MKYIIIDNKSGLPIKFVTNNMNKARNKANNLDLQYGAVRYYVQIVKGDN